MKKSTFLDRIRRAWRAFCGKPADRIVVGFEVKRCSECEHRRQSEGEWVRQQGRPEAICSKCGSEVVYQVIDNKWAFENFCPHCGAKMKRGEIEP